MSATGVFFWGTKAGVTKLGSWSSMWPFKNDVSTTTYYVKCRSQPEKASRIKYYLCRVLSRDTFVLARAHINKQAEYKWKIGDPISKITFTHMHEMLVHDVQANDSNFKRLYAIPVSFDLSEISGKY